MMPVGKDNGKMGTFSRKGAESTIIRYLMGRKVSLDRLTEAHSVIESTAYRHARYQRAAPAEATVA